jgi:hypothetical protein
MKDLQTVAFDPTQCRKELDRLQALLASRAELSESDDVQPLFKSCHQLAAFIGTTIPGIGPATRLAFEFDVFGHYTADLVIGDFEKKTVCAIEFEDAREHSVFHKVASRSQKEWGRRLEHGFGQLIDWFYSFDDHKNSTDFAKHFGHEHIEFYGMLLIGRSAHLTDYDRTRLRWRSDRVTINTHKVYCRTYDELLEALNRQWRLFSLIGQKPQAPPT